MASDLRLNDCQFDLRPAHGWYWDGDRLRASIPSRYVTSHTGQLSLLPSVGREMSTGQSVVMRRGQRIKAEWLIPFVDKRVNGR